MKINIVNKIIKKKKDIPKNYNSFLRFIDVSAGYGKQDIIKNINLEIKEGEFVSIIGPNGNGKSTLLLALLKIIKISTGKIIFKDNDIFDYKNKELSKQISYVPQINAYPEDVTVYEFVKMGRFPWNNTFFSEHETNEKKILNAIKTVNLEDQTHQYISNLSGGQKQKALIAMSLAQDTNLIVLDEPTNHLDIKSQLEIVHLLHELNHKLNKTIIMVIHDINHALRFSDKLIFFKNGEIKIQGKKSDVVNKENIMNIFEVEPIFIENNNKKIIADYWDDNLGKIHDEDENK